MHTVAAKQDANTGGQTLTKPESIYRLLKKLGDQRITLKIRFTSVDGNYNSQIVGSSLQERFFILDEITPEWGHKAACKGDSLTFEATLNGCRIASGPVRAQAKGEHHGSPIYKLPFPDELFYEQRRKIYRTPVRRSLNILAEIPSTDQDDVYTAQLRDISPQGCQLEFGGDLREQLAAGTVIENCVLIFPSQQTIPFGIEIRHTQFKERDSITLCGCQFTKLDPMEERKIALCVTELQRENARINTEGTGTAPISDLLKPKPADSPDTKPEEQEAVTSSTTQPKLSQEIKSEVNAVKRHNDRLRHQQAHAHVRRIHIHTVNLVKNITIQAKLGQAIDIEAVLEQAEQLVDLILQYPDDLLCMGRIRNKENYLIEHSTNVAILLALFGRHEGFKHDTLIQITAGGLLHDIGKALIPERILDKPGKLSTQERRVIQQHVNQASELLAQSTSSLPEPIRAVVQENCERIDGSGYPNGLKGDSISTYGKMAAIVDTYDAMTADRSYSRKLSPPLALKKLLQLAQTHYDKTLVHTFIRCMGIYPVGTLVRFSNNELGFVMQLNHKTLLPAVVRLVYSAAFNRHLSPTDIDLTDPEIASQYGKIQGSDNPDAYNINSAVIRAAI